MTSYGIAVPYPHSIVVCQDKWRCWFHAVCFRCVVGTGERGYQQGPANHMRSDAGRDGYQKACQFDNGKTLWGRSLNRGFRYTTMVSDGDARTFTDVTENGDDVTNVKEECINNVAKRMGTELRKLTKQTKKAGVTLGGRGKAKLTQWQRMQSRSWQATIARPYDPTQMIWMACLCHLQPCLIDRWEAEPWQVPKGNQQLVFLPACIDWS